MAEAVARTGEVALVIPALNEALRIREVVEQAEEILNKLNHDNRTQALDRCGP